MCILGKAIHDLATKLLPEVVSIGKCLNMLPGSDLDLYERFGLKHQPYGTDYISHSTLEGNKQHSACVALLLSAKH